MKLNKYIPIILVLCSIVKFSSASISSRKISIIGTGYVGLVTAACLAHFGHDVICADIDENKIHSLNNNKIPIYEPGLDKLIEEAKHNNNISFTNDIPNAIKSSDIIFIAVGTPMDSDGKADLNALYSAANIIAKNTTTPKIICIKSTVPIGTCNKLKKFIISNIPDEIENKNKLTKIVFNPEFLREGSAIQDSLCPDRIVLGGSSKGIEIIKDVYKYLLNQNYPLIITNLETAETIKYAANAFLAIKISYINEIAKLCDAVLADCTVVAHGIGLDKRIGDKFLKPGPGYGGSCFPKDSQALLYTANLYNNQLKILKSAVKVNKNQIKYVFRKFLNLMNNNLENKTVAILGLAFKANTDDIRYSPAIYFINNLKQYNCNIKAYDPIASANMKKQIPDIEYTKSIESACKNADAVIILTEWPEFQHLDLKYLKGILNKPVLLDARNIVNTDKLKELKYKYSNIGNARVTN